VIICTGCGRKNDDEARFCKKCGKKLQSSFQSTGPVSSGPAPLERFENKRLPADAWASLKRMAEAWVYVLILAAVGAGCMIQETWWPLYPTVGLIGLIAWFRRI